MLRRFYALSPRARLEPRDDAAVLVCGHPLLALRLNPSARALLEALRPGMSLDALAEGVTPEALRYLDDLVSLGALRGAWHVHPAVPAAIDDPPPVEVVIPVLDNPVGLARCLEALARQTWPAARLRITVVDDGSERPVAVPTESAARLSLRVLRLPTNRGPASARNHGVRTPWPDAPPAPWLAFVDSDCVPDPDWLAGLWAGLATGSGLPGLDAVGGAVRPLELERPLARYEGASSSLVLGERPGAVGGRHDALAYLPSCNLAVRREAFEAVGGFREGWRFGEDVDLCWRLADAGHLLGYLGGPAYGNAAGGGVRHDFRTHPGPFMGRRRSYARSEAPLRAAHPQRFGRGVPLWLLPGAAALALGPVLGLALHWAVLSALALWLAGSAATVMRALAGGVAWALPLRERRGPGAVPFSVLRTVSFSVLRTMPLAVLRTFAGGLVQGARRAWRTTGVLWLALAVAAMSAAASCAGNWGEGHAGCGGRWLGEGASGMWLLGGGMFALAALGEALSRRRTGVRLPPWPEFLGGLLLDGAAYSLGWLEGRLSRAGRKRHRGNPPPQAAEKDSNAGE